VIETDAFSNKERSIDDLEAPAEMNFEALSPAYKKMLFVSTSLVVTGVVVLNLTINLVATGSLQSLLTSLGAIIASSFLMLAAILSLILPNLVWRSKGYQVREHDLHFRRGMIWRHVTSLPFVRVQHVELESGPVERYFKLATLKFYTAGGGSSDMSIPGLPYSAASKIRSYVMARAGVGHGSSTEAEDTPLIDKQPIPIIAAKDTPAV